MEAEKSVKRTSIRRNTQLRTLCGDVSNPWKTSRLSTSPLASSICSNNGGISSRRKEAKTASPRSPWQKQSFVDRSNKRSPHNSSSLAHKGGNSSAASPPPSLKTDAGKHELLAERPHDHTSRGKQAESSSTVNIFTAQSSSNNSFGIYVQQELAKHNNKTDRQSDQRIPMELPHLASNARWARTQPPTTMLQGWVTDDVPPPVNLQMKCPRGKQRTEKNLQAGQIRRLSSVICTSTSGSSSVSAHSSSGQKHMPKYHKPASVDKGVPCNEPTSASNQVYCNKPAFKTVHSLPKENILTTLTGKSPPQMPAFSTLAAVSGRNRFYRSPQKCKSPESYHKSGSSSHFSRRGLYGSPAGCQEVVNTPSVLYKSGDAFVDCCYPMNHESNMRPQRPASRSVNKENFYCTYLHQDAPGQLQVNCQHYKKLVSKETQYSDTESLCSKPTTQSHSNRVTRVKDHCSSPEPSGDVNTATRREATECQGQPACTIDVLLRRDDDVDKSSDRCASDSSHGGFKCDSLLKEILKAVTSKIARPAVENKCNPQLSKASDETVLESFADTVKTEHDTESPPCLFSKQSNKCASLNPASNRHVSRSSGSNSGKSALPSLVSYSHNEPTQEHSTVSLEVKSVNLCFRCTNKNADKNSAQQINIKWTTSPNTKSKWKAECIEVTGLSDRPEQLANSLKESSQKFSQRTCEHGDLPEQLHETKQVTTTALVSNKVTEKSGAEQQASKTEDATGSRFIFSAHTKRMLSRPSDTCLTSPSPCKSHKSRNRRPAPKPKSDQSESLHISTADQTRAAHEGSKADESHQTEHSPHAATSEDDGNNCLNQRPSGTLLPHKAVCTNPSTHNDVAYRHKSAAKVLARNPEDNLVPRTDDRFLLLQLDWGVFIIFITTIPMLLLLLSLNFYVRASTVTPESPQGTS